MKSDCSMDKKAILPVKSDVVFRLFYADERNEEFLVGLLKSMLSLPEDDYHKIEIADPHLLREFDGDKLAIIDVKLYTKTRKIVHIEIQLKVTPKLRNRVILYDAKLIAEQIGSGNDYEVIKKVISIIIVDENLIEGSQKYHHRFTLYDADAKVEFSDLLEIHTLELRKLPEGADGTELYDWAKFIDAETEEELVVIEQRNPTIKKAIVKLRELSADEEARSLYERREKARRDRAEEMRWAIEQGLQQGVQQEKIETANNAFQLGMCIDDIVKLTGLMRVDVERISKAFLTEAQSKD